MRKTITTLVAIGLLAGATAPVAADDRNQYRDTFRRYETTLVGAVETATVAGATTVYVHVTNSAAIKRTSAPKFEYQFKGRIVPIKIDTNTVVRRLPGVDKVAMTTTGWNALTTIPMLAGDRVTAKVRCAAVNPPDCVASRIDVLTPKPPEPKRYSMVLIGRVASLADTRTLVMRPVILRGEPSTTLVPAMLGTDVRILATNTTRVVIGTSRSTGTFAGITAGQLAWVEARCLTPVAPATQWVCTAEDVEVAALT